MFFISHRGNLSGIEKETENLPIRVLEAIKQGYMVMVNVWAIGNDNFALGELRPQYPVELDFLSQKTIICQAMTVQTMVVLMTKEIHCFYRDCCNKVALTNGGLLWSDHNSELTVKSIYYMPEWNMRNPEDSCMLKCFGICSNNIDSIRSKYFKLTEHLSQKDLDIIKEESEDEDSA